MYSGLDGNISAPYPHLPNYHTRPPKSYPKIPRIDKQQQEDTIVVEIPDDVIAYRDPVERIFRISMAIFITCCLVFMSQAFLFQLCEVPTSSMADTIEPGDLLFAEKISLRKEPPKNGDIVTFKDPENSHRNLVKRVIATQGQVVTLADDIVYVDNIAIDEPYIDNQITTPFYRTLKDISYPYIVPAGEVWVMGDNRGNSEDSRYFGSIPIDSITSKVLFVYWPIEHWKTVQ